MWSILTILILTVTLAFTTPLEPNTENNDPEGSLRPSKNYFHQAPIRLHVKGHNALDGKVRNIQVNPEDEDGDEGRSGVHVYGLLKNRFDDNGVIERVALEKDPFEENPENEKLITAFGMPKERLENNGFIERVQPSSRLPRSVRKETENELEDLEAQDAKVFRPLFVYRQQVAERQRRNRKKNFIRDDYRRHHNHHHKPYRSCVYEHPTH